jgi:AcrR family transcriptional regulator
VPSTTSATKRASGSSSRTLSTDSVVAVALALADAEGIAAVTLGGVARALGCHVTSLYTHVDSIDDLHVRMAMVVQADLSQRLWQAALGRARADALGALADVYRGFGAAAPVRTRLLFARASTADQRFRDGAQTLAEPIRATLRSFGLDDLQVRHAHRAFSASMRGFLLGEAEGLYGSVSDADATFEQIIALYTTALDRGDWPVAAAEPATEPMATRNRAR